MSVSEAAPRSADADGIISAAIAIVADAGLRGLTLRDLAQSVGRSTTVIVNLFGSKAGLVEAMGEAAFAQDALFHRQFFLAVSGLPVSRDPLLTIMMRYLRTRTAADAVHVRVWEAMMLTPEGGETRRSLMARWERMRLDAWLAHLASDRRLAERAPLLTNCLAMEQFYAGALLDFPEYEAICSESLGGLIDHALGRVEEPASATLWHRSRLMIPPAPADSLEPDSIRLKLLNIAADQILAGGIGAVTNRSVSSVAGTSTSTIQYHWPDMRRFLTDAVWHSVFRDLPYHLDRRRAHPEGPPADLTAWSHVMAATVHVDDGARAGFYVKYARLIANICLEARRDPAFRDLAMMLRGPEGGGTYNSRADAWPTGYALTRLAATRVALWIKGRALAASVVGVSPAASELEAAAALLVARCGDERPLRSA